MSAEGKWIVLWTAPGAERRAAENVKRQGFTYYQPVFAEQAVVRGKRVERIKNLFPRYLPTFIQTQWHCLLGTFGVVDIVRGVGGYPAELPESAIETLKSQEDERGLISLPGVELAPPVFAIDQKVRAENSTVFGGHTGLFQGQDAKGRCWVLMNLLGRGVPVPFDESDLVAA